MPSITQRILEDTASVLFEPEGDLRYLTQHFEQTPHYLFRTYAPRSNGVSLEALRQLQQSLERTLLIY